MFRPERTTIIRGDGCCSSVGNRNADVGSDTVGFAASMAG